MYSKLLNVALLPLLRAVASDAADAPACAVAGDSAAASSASGGANTAARRDASGAGSGPACAARAPRVVRGRNSAAPAAGAVHRSACIAPRSRAQNASTQRPGAARSAGKQHTEEERARELTRRRRGAAAKRRPLRGPRMARGRLRAAAALLCLLALGVARGADPRRGGAARCGAACVCAAFALACGWRG
jgi:hypothetical protein